MLFDNHGRIINYVRLAVTDRCNLRCYYCMPEEGIRYVNRRDLMTFEEMENMLRIMASMGITKVRITGGEPFIRKGILDFLGRIGQIPGIESIHVTTNGTFTAEVIEELERMNINSVNLSLDTLDPDRFKQITRRDAFHQVMNTLYRLMDSPIRLKINAVVMANQNTEDIGPMIELTRDHQLDVRFIEEMPFNGTDRPRDDFWPAPRILQHIRNLYPGITSLPVESHATSMNYAVPGYAGKVGIIAAFSRTFCGTCNRIRITPQGDLRTCLYGDAVLNFRDLIREGASEDKIRVTLRKALTTRHRDGFDAQAARNNPETVSESMATIGG